MDGPYFLPSGGNKENLKDLISQLIILSSFLLNSKFISECVIQEELYGKKAIENTFKHARVESNRKSLKGTSMNNLWRILRRLSLGLG